MKRVFCLLVWLLCSVSLATTYYVNPADGDDDANGLSLGTAWETFARALPNSAGTPKVVGGDTIKLRTGEYGSINISYDPTSYANYPTSWDEAITYQADTDAIVVFSGDANHPQLGHVTVAIYGDYDRYLIFNGLKFIDSTVRPAAALSSLWSIKTSCYIKIQSCTLIGREDVGTTINYTPNGGVTMNLLQVTNGGIAVGSATYTTVPYYMWHTIRDIYITDCDISYTLVGIDISLGSAELRSNPVTGQTTGENIVVTGNYIHNALGSTIRFVTWDSLNEIICTGNTISHEIPILNYQDLNSSTITFGPVVGEVLEQSLDGDNAFGKVYAVYNESQDLEFSDGVNTPTGGTFTLTYAGQTTSAIAYDISAAGLTAALEALSTIGAGNVSCTKGTAPDNDYRITFIGELGSKNLPLITCEDAGLTGTTPTGTVTANANGSGPRVKTFSQVGFQTGSGQPITGNIAAAITEVDSILNFWTHASGISIKVRNVNASNNVIRGIGTTSIIGTYRTGMGTSSPTSVSGYSGMTINNNVIYDSAAVGALVMEWLGDNVSICGNTVVGYEYYGSNYYNTYGNQARISKVTGRPPTNVVVKGNIFVGSVAYYYQPLTGPALTLLNNEVDEDYNIYWGCIKGDNTIAEKGTGTVNGAHSFVYEKQSGDPVAWPADFFVDADFGRGTDTEHFDDGGPLFTVQDYSLAAGSPAIDFGVTGYGTITDILGATRDTLPDAGAYEYISGSPPEEPPIEEPSIFNWYRLFRGRYVPGAYKRRYNN